MEEIITRSAVLAAEINTIKSQTLKVVLSASVEIGKRLSEAKSLVPYGEWENWLETNVDYSQSTANNLMRISTEYGNDQIDMFSRPKQEIFGSLSYSQAVALFALPAEEREDFVESHDMGTMSVRELNAQIDLLKKEKSDADNMIVELDKSRREAIGRNETLREKIEHTEQESTKNGEAKKTLEKDIKELRKALKEAVEKQSEQTSIEPKMSDEDIAKLRAEITEEIASEKDAKEAELKKRIADDTEEIAQLDTEHKAELERRDERITELESQKAAIEKKLGASSDGVINQFAALFEAFQEDFARMERKLAKITASDTETAEKLSGALSKILDGMSERIGG